MGGYRGGRWLTYVCSRQGLSASLQKAATERLLFKKIRHPFFQGYFRLWLMFKAQSSVSGKQRCAQLYSGQSVLKRRSEFQLCVEWFDTAPFKCRAQTHACIRAAHFAEAGVEWCSHTHAQRFLQETTSLCQRSIIACFSRLTHSWVDMKPVVLVKAFRLTDWRAECEKHLEVNISVRTVTSG